MSTRSSEEAWVDKKDNFISVSNEISSDWTWLARKLNLSEAVIKGIDADYKEAREKAYQALVKWYEENGRYSATKEKLCEALNAINKKDIAERICGCDVNNHRRSQNKLRRCAAFAESDIASLISGLKFKNQSENQSQSLPGEDHDDSDTKTEQPEESKLLIRFPFFGNCLVNREVVVVVEKCSDCLQTPEAVLVLEEACADKCETKRPIPENHGEAETCDTKL